VDIIPTDASAVLTATTARLNEGLPEGWSAYHAGPDAGKYTIILRTRPPKHCIGAFVRVDDQAFEAACTRAEGVLRGALEKCVNGVCRCVGARR
jgi:hypothetical protein